MKSFINEYHVYEASKAFETNDVAHEAKVEIESSSNKHSNDNIISSHDEEKDTPAVVEEDTSYVYGGDYSFITPNQSLSSSDNIKTMIYITTHFSNQHIFYLTECWPLALEHVPLLRHSDIVIYLNPDENEEDPDKLSTAMKLLKQTFYNQNLHVHIRNNKGYDGGAMSAISDAAKEGWFENYDWIFRVNPDVIIRDDSYIQSVMKNDAEATGILINCVSSMFPIAHTDFFGFQPQALSLPNVFLTNIGSNAEKTFTNQIRKDILDKGGARWVDDAKPMSAICRAGYGRENSETPITHFHADDSQIAAAECPVPF